MSLQPRPRGESVLTRRLVVTVGLSGLAITVGLLALLGWGTSRFGGLEVARSGRPPPPTRPRALILARR